MKIITESDIFDIIALYIRNNSTGRSHMIDLFRNEYLTDDFKRIIYNNITFINHNIFIDFVKETVLPQDIIIDICKNQSISFSTVFGYQKFEDETILNIVKFIFSLGYDTTSITSLLHSIKNAFYGNKHFNKNQYEILDKYIKLI